jgi:hypothetical protein
MTSSHTLPRSGTDYLDDYISNGLVAALPLCEICVIGG